MTSVVSGADLTTFQRVVWVVARALVVSFAKVWFRYEVHGRENLPADGAFILSPNHRSNLDTPLLPVIRKAPIRFMGKDSLWNVNALAAWFLTTLGGFPVDRDSADRVALKSAEGIIERGEVLVMFPEGMRRDGPTVLEENMFSGPSFVAGRQQVPIVPVGIAGTEQAMTIGSWWIRPTKLVFVIGEPLDPPVANENGRVPRRAVQEHTDVLRTRIQAAFDEAKSLRS